MARRRRRDLTIPTALLVLNATTLIAAMGFAASGAVRPSIVHAGAASPEDLRRSWAAASALRTFAIVAPSFWLLVRRRRAARTMLALAGSVQLGDSALGIWQRNAPAATVSALMGIVNIATAASRSR